MLDVESWTFSPPQATPVSRARRERPRGALRAAKLSTFNFQRSTFNVSARETSRLLPHLPGAGGHDTVCAETVRAFARTDWPAPLEVFLNESDAPVRHERITAGMLALLRRALETDAGAFLLCEDDTRFNAHLHHNLATWPPLRRGALALGSLYNPGATDRPAPVAGDTALLVEPELAIGAQARVFSRACAAHILREFRPSAWHQDLALARLAAELAPLHYHVPCRTSRRGKHLVRPPPSCPGLRCRLAPPLRFLTRTKACDNTSEGLSHFDQSKPPRSAPAQIHAQR